MIRLIKRESGFVVGEGQHRSGWPFALQALKPLLSRNGILFDDFIEASFSFFPVKAPHKEPWIGVFHTPHDAPVFLLPQKHALMHILNTSLFKESLPHLKLGVTLSGRLAEWLSRTLGVPFISLLHPTETSKVMFSEEAFLANNDKRIVQIGRYLRNTSAIYQLEAPKMYKKTCLFPFDNSRAKEYMKRVGSLWHDYNWAIQWNGKGAGRLPSGKVESSGRISDDAYDRLLSKNVVFVEFFSTAANNIVVECIVRNTPLVVNRLPALEEYLGKGYPLFYDRFEEAPELFAEEKILEGHAYMKGMDKRIFTGDFFRSNFIAGLKKSGAFEI